MSDCTIGRFDYRALADFAFGDGDAGVVEALEQAMIAVADAVAHGSCVEDATFGLSSAPSDPALSPAVPLSPAGNLVRDPASFKDAYVAFSEGLDSANDVYEKDAYMRVCKGVPMPDREALMDSLAKRLEGVLEPVRPLLRQDAWPTGGGRGRVRLLNAVPAFPESSLSYRDLGDLDIATWAELPCHLRDQP